MKDLTRPQKALAYLREEGFQASLCEHTQRVVVIVWKADLSDTISVEMSSNDERMYARMYHETTKEA